MVLVLVQSLFSLPILSALNYLLLPLNVVGLLGCILSDVVRSLVLSFFFASVGPPC